MKEAFVLPVGLEFDGAARALMKRGYGVNCAMQATISSQRRIHIYEGSSKYRRALLHLSFQSDTIVPLPFLTTKLQSYFPSILSLDRYGKHSYCLVP
jgi:hypothetical protein